MFMGCVDWFKVNHGVQKVITQSTFRGIIKSHIISFHHISSNLSDFHQATHILFKALKTRGYSKRFLCKIKYDTLAALIPTCSDLDSDPPQIPQVERLPPPGTFGPSHPNLLPLSKPNPPTLTLTSPLPNPYPKPNFLSPQAFQTLSPLGAKELLQTPKHIYTGHQHTTASSFVSLFSHKIMRLHWIIKHTFSHLQSQLAPLHNYRILSAFRKNKGKNQSSVDPGPLQIHRK